MMVRYPPPHKRGISATLARYPLKTREMGAMPPPLRYYLESVLRAMGGGGISHWAAKTTTASLCTPLYCKNLCCASRFCTCGQRAAGSRSKNLLKGALFSGLDLSFLFLSSLSFLGLFRFFSGIFPTSGRRFFLIGPLLLRLSQPKN